MAEKLGEYRKKRNFEKTGEPSGGTIKSGPTLKFAVQYHLARREHYDLRLEWEGVLLSWAVPKGPSYNTKDRRLAVMVEDHPLEYSDFEGIIPKGEYGGGTVMLWDKGVWTPVNDVKEGLGKGSLKFRLDGERLKGRWTLVRIKGEEDDDENNWLLIKEKDEFAKNTNGISAFKQSVSSGRTAKEIEKQELENSKKNPLDTLNVQLARLVDWVPDEKGWLYEVKYDGYRIVAFAERGKARLMTRNDHDFSEKFASVALSLGKWSDGRAMILDGEIVITDEDGRSDFQALQNYVREPDGKGLTYMVFDLIALDGKDLRGLPLVERKEKLEKLLETAPDNIRYSKHVEDMGEECFKAAEKLGMEGIVGKKGDSPYSGNRNGDWIKLKCYRRQEFVIGGYTKTEKSAYGLSAVLLGYYDNGKLIYAGRAGTGFDRRNSAEFLKTCESLKTDKKPFSTADTSAVRGGKEEVFWLKPKLIAEIQFAEITDENLLRQASFKGLRRDKSPKEVVMEIPEKIPGKKIKPAAKSVGKKNQDKPKKGQSEISVFAESARKAEKPINKLSDTQKNADKIRGNSKNKNESPIVCGVNISSPDKVVYTDPEIRKLDVINYYAKAAKRMLPYAGGRILSVVRCHKGVSNACFYKKHPATESEGVRVVSVANTEGVTDDYFYIENATGLINEAQLGSIEFHVWGSRADSLEKPDLMVFDLDPDEGMELARVRQGVRDLKKVLDGLNLKSFLKTSGGKGYHVVVPFKPSVDWETFHDFAERIANIMVEKWPDRYTANVRKIKRKGKIFIDWMRNGRGATSVAPYSLRARPGARVSMPISWKELDTVAPDGIDLNEALRRLSLPDPWRNISKTEQKIKI